MKTRRPEYVTVGGLADFSLSGLVAGASGMIVGGVNVAARWCSSQRLSRRLGTFEEIETPMTLESELATSS